MTFSGGAATGRSDELTTEGTRFDSGKEGIEDVKTKVGVVREESIARDGIGGRGATGGVIRGI